MAQDNQPSDDEFEVFTDPSGVAATVTFPKSTGAIPINGPTSTMSVRIPIEDHLNKTPNQIRSEAKARARPMFRELIRRYRGKDD